MAEITSGTFILLIGSGSPSQEMETSPDWESTVNEPPQAASIISDAETRGRDEIARMEAKKAELDARIGELREFERDYRSQLRNFIEGHLKDLDSSSTDSASVANITN